MVDFPGGANPLVWGKDLLFDKIFAENCMKMKEIGLGGARIPSATLWIRHCKWNDPCYQKEIKQLNSTIVFEQTAILIDIT